MVVRVLVAVVMTTAVFSSAAFSASPLHELATTPGPTLVCGNVAVHANAAIAATLHGDDAIARSLIHLRTVDFDTIGGPRKLALTDLGIAARDIRRNADRARDETQRLRGFADHPAGEARKADLDGLADDLNAALDLQREVARALDAFVGGVAYRAIGGGKTQTATEFAAIDTTGIGVAHSASSSAFAPSLPSPPLGLAASGDTVAARAVANELLPRIGEIEADEARAATHSEPAIGGC